MKHRYDKKKAEYKSRWQIAKKRGLGRRSPAHRHNGSHLQSNGIHRHHKKMPDTKSPKK